MLHSSILTLASVALCAPAVFGAPQGGGGVDDRVIHLYVDPHYGSDSLALGLISGTVDSWNPDGADTVDTGCAAQPLRPNDEILSGGTDPLLHAPYPFRTIGGAIQYINEIPGLAGLPAGTPPLPYTASSPGSAGHVWTHAIIHLMPGVYSGSTAQHVDILLDGNGEEFPIVIPPRVSIQGTSAMNTIIALEHAADPPQGSVVDAEEYTAFVFGQYFDPATGAQVSESHPNAVAADGEGCFISGVCFYGGGVNMGLNDYQSYGLADQRWQGAILVDNEVAAKPVITNCFFAKNRVGILVNARDALSGGPDPIVDGAFHHGLAVINNTFVWNGVGIWNGEQATAPEAETVEGLSKLVLVNNIFDSTEPGTLMDATAPVAFCEYFTRGNATPFTWPFGGANSNFEGVARADMRADISGSGATLIDFNGYEQTTRTPVLPDVRDNFNKGHNGAILTRVVLPRVVLRSGAVTPSPAPSRNIAEITGYEASQATSGFQPRGVLYVTDLICLGREDGTFGDPRTGGNFPATREFEGSPLDFRLAPNSKVYADADFQIAPTNLANPMVDNGLDITLPVPGGLFMENGEAVPVPGIGPHAHFPFTAWEYDGEGFGNPRIHDHPHAYYDTEYTVDIGADELGDLLVAGYLMGTTSFIGLRENHPSNPRGGLASGSNPRIIRNNFQWYLSVANTNFTQMTAGHQADGFPDPKYRFYDFDDFEDDWPLAYGLGGNPADPRPTWHSTEDLTGPVVWQRPWRFFGLPTSNPPGSLQALYLATAADITPQLMPDAHPWWSQSGLASGVANATPPTLTLWQSCLGAGTFNQALFLPVTEPVINPPGSYEGFVDVVRDFDFVWLDGLALTTPFNNGVPNYAAFRNWMVAPPPPQLRNVDGFCRVDNPSPPALLPWRAHQLPSTVVFDQDGTELPPVAIRFATEFNKQGLLSADRNLQSFMVLQDYLQPIAPGGSQ